MPSREQRLPGRSRQLDDARLAFLVLCSTTRLGTHGRHAARDEQQAPGGARWVAAPLPHP
jgi:hypothetical protein